MSRRCRHVTGLQPVCRDAFIITVIKGNGTSIDSFRMNVGIGSSVDDFVDDSMIIRRTASSSQVRTSASDASVPDCISGDGPPTDSTSLSKNGGMTNWPIGRSTDDRSASFLVRRYRFSRRRQRRRHVRNLASYTMVTVAVYTRLRTIRWGAMYRRN